MRAGLLTYFNRASLCALFLTLRNFPQSQFQSKTKATKSLTDGNSPPCVILIHGITIYLYVGFCVARSTEMGNAKASGVERVTDTDSHAFCVMCAIEN